jgi:CrcB protein
VERFLIVCGAGAAGCGLRYLVSLWAAKRIGTTFPWGTLIVNLAGSFLIALILEYSTRKADFSPNLRIALTTGFLGGLTTYSSFNYETTALVTGGNAVRGLINIGVTLIGCLTLGYLGLLLGRRIS